MARIDYDSATPMGSLTAEGINALIRGQETLQRVQYAADIASNAGTNTAKLEGGDFGVAAGQGQAYWDTLTSIVNLLKGLTPNGYNQFLGSMDNGG
jgi:hypothetical protein